MRIELIEKAFAQLAKNPEKAKAGHRKLAATYEGQPAFTGWENYKKPYLGDDENPGWALCHYDSAKAVKIDGKVTERRKQVKAVRYALYRWRTQERVAAQIEGQKERKEKPRKPNKMEKAHAKIAAEFGKNLAVIHNGGAFGFAVKWDVDPMDPTKVYVRGESVEQQWDEEAEYAAKDLPLKGK